MGTLTIIGIFVVGILLAFPTAIAICATGGLIAHIYDRLTTARPKCGRKKMKGVNGIRETYPTGRGTGTFYLC